MAQYLFLGTDIQVLIERTQDDLLDEIERVTDTVILSRSNEDWLKHFMEKYTIRVPTLDTNKVERTYEDGLVPQYQVPNPNFDKAPRKILLAKSLRI